MLVGIRLILSYLYTKSLWNMLIYCLKVKKDVDPKVLKSKNGRRMLSSEGLVCSSKKSRFFKEQEAKGLLYI